MSRGELGAGVILGERALFLWQKQVAIVVAAHAHDRAAKEQIGGACWVEWAGQVISQIHDLLDASAIDILQDRLQGPTIPMNIGNDRQRSVIGLRFAHGFLFRQSREFSEKATISLLLCKYAHVGTASQ